MTVGLFRREDSGEIVVALRAEEAAVLRGLVGELSTLVDQRPDRSDPVISRLLPDAYDDEQDAAEFRRFTESDLRLSKRELANQLLADVPRNGGPVRLDEEGADGWLRTLNDVRLALGTRLGIGDEESPADELAQSLAASTPDDEPSARVAQLSVYAYLTYLQESLVEALAG